MAGAFEQTIIIGNVGRDAEQKFTQSGVAFTSFSVAVTSKWTDSATNEQREKTNWYRCTAWRGLAEVCGKYVKKGMSVMVSGNVQASGYLDAEGEPKASLELTARDVQFLTRVDGAGSSTSNDSDEHKEQIPF